MSDKELTAINDIHHNVYVKASAGTGKTYTLTQRYLEIVEQNLSKSDFCLQNILAITFTRAAALEMRTRIRDELLKKQATAEEGISKRIGELLKQFDRANILTIDALEGQILRENPVEAALAPDYALLSEEEYQLKIKEEVRRFLVGELDGAEYGILKGYYNFRDIAKLLTDMVLKDKWELFHRDDLLKFAPADFKKDETTEAETVPDICLQRSLAILSLYDKFEQYFMRKKDNNDILSFADVARRAVKLLQTQPNIAKKYQDMYRYIMVDEFQDTNDSQRRLVYLLTGDATGEKIVGDKLFIVGDMKQSIYRFRGAEVKVFDDVCDSIKAARGNSYILSTNRRSYSEVLNYVNEVFLSDEGKLEKYGEEQLVPFYKDAVTAKPVLNIFNGEESPNIDQKCSTEAKAVAGYIKKVLQEMATPTAEGDNAPKTNGKIAILLKTMTHLDAITSALSEAHIPYSVVGDKGFYKQQEVQDLFHLFCFLNDPEQENLALLGILRSPYFALSDEEIKQFARDKEKSLWQNLLELGQGIRVVRAKKILQELVLAAKFLPPAELWQRVLRVINVDFVLLAQEDGREQNYNQLLANAEKLQTNCLEQCNQHGWNLSQWLDYIKDIVDVSKDRAADLPSSNAVEIMTMHKSKGLQFETVILPFLGTYAKNNYTHDNFLLNIEKLQFALKTDAITEKGKSTKAKDFCLVKDLEDAAEERENARLFYVACTRAEKRLYLSGFAPEAKDKDKFQFVKMALAGKAMAEVLSGEMFADEAEATESRVIADVQTKLVDKTENFALGSVTYFTPSRLQTYLHCQRQYYYQYGCNLPSYEAEQNDVNASSGENKNPDELTPAEQGTLIHMALEYYHGDKEDAWRRAVKNVCFEYKSLEKAHNLYTNYTNSDLFKKIPEKHQREVSFQLPVDEGVVFGGIIDCLYAKADGTFGVVDYKTGKVPDTLNEGYAMQLAIYAKAVEQMRLGEVTELQLHYLQSCEPRSIIDKDVYTKALELAKEIQKKRYEQDFETNCTRCRNCGYAYLCRHDDGMRQEEGTAPGIK